MTTINCGLHGPCARVGKVLHCNVSRLSINLKINHDGRHLRTSALRWKLPAPRFLGSGNHLIFNTQTLICCFSHHFPSGVPRPCNESTTIHHRNPHLMLWWWGIGSRIGAHRSTKPTSSSAASALYAAIVPADLASQPPKPQVSVHFGVSRTAGVERTSIAGGAPPIHVPALILRQLAIRAAIPAAICNDKRSPGKYVCAYVPRVCACVPRLAV